MEQEQERHEDKSAGDLIAMLRVIQGEYSQLSELVELEAQETKKLVNGLRVLQSAVEQVIPISKEVLGDTFDGVTEAYLASECIVVANLGNGTMVSRPLIALPSRIILGVVQDCVPDMNRLISEQRRELHARINLLERALKELKKSESAIRTVKEPPDVGPSQRHEDDLMRRSLSSA